MVKDADVIARAESVHKVRRRRAQVPGAGSQGQGHEETQKGSGWAATRFVRREFFQQPISFRDQIIATELAPSLAVLSGDALLYKTFQHARSHRSVNPSACPTWLPSESRRPVPVVLRLSIVGRPCGRPWPGLGHPFVRAHQPSGLCRHLV
jgi:hypothetical protein